MPLNSEQRAAVQGEIPYWGAGGVLDHVSSALFDEPLVLLGEDGAPFFDAGKDVAYYLEGPVWVNNHMHVLRPNGCDGKFLAYALNAVDYANYITGSTRDKLTQEDLKQIVVPLPTLEEQRRIADFLDAETARIGKIQECVIRQTSLLKIRRRAFIESLVNEFAVDPETIALRFVLRPSYDSDRPDLQVLSVYRDYGVIPKNSRQDNFNKTPEDVGRYLLVRRGDLVVNKMKAWQGSLGVSMHEGIVSPDYLVARITTTAIDREFLHYLLRSPQFTAEYAVRSKGIRPSQWRLYWEDLAQVKIPVIPLQEQVEAVSLLKHEDAWVERSLSAIHKRLDLLGERRAALITAAVTGQIDLSTAGGRGIED